MLGFLVGAGYAQEQEAHQRFFGPAIASQQRHTDDLLTISDVVGTAVGVTAAGEAAIKVYTRAPGVKGIPSSLDGIPVVVEVTGDFFAFRPGGQDALPAGKGGTKIDPKRRFERPVPIGVSTGNEGECSAGTIGARVKDVAENVYALSNNHVYALENEALIGSNVLQPGRYDTNCSIDPLNFIGTLDDFEPIVFTTDANNIIDAAIALSNTLDLGNATPSNGYGTPKSVIASAFVGQDVQKYGRTTSLTKGKVSGINATVNIIYSSGTARFVNQIVITGNKGPFIRSGDSGSLLVTNPGRAPVGLLFAGTSSGTAIANPISAVLVRFGVTIDGE
jgi:hypothetical protein